MFKKYNIRAIHLPDTLGIAVLGSRQVRRKSHFTSMASMNLVGLARSESPPQSM
jgi:hypothetical protein